MAKSTFALCASVDYRARDTKLNRDVAVKALPETVAQDLNHLGRFKREAQVLAALNIVDALPIARQLAEALEAAHESGISHRDLKPANVKIRADGTVKVLDSRHSGVYVTGASRREAG
jgi:eukaryotic-like serine/threonine-protein kinase